MHGSEPYRDGLSTPAIAAFLLMNNDSGAVDEFLEAYADAKRLGNDAEISVELAMAGLRTESEIAEVRATADDLDLPVAIAAALLDRGNRAVDSYHELAASLLAEGVESDVRRTIAALLAISLEPSLALGKWVEARDALARLGLTGAYADTAAAFGASDPRGPQAFAVSYAAQRQALGSRRRRGCRPVRSRVGPRRHPARRGFVDRASRSRLRCDRFDPFTLLYYRWIILGGTGHGHGWEPIYQDQSWSQDKDSWFGGFGGGGGFGGSGSSGGSSSWGSSWSGSSGGFGGFSGGGGFGGGSFGGGGGGGSSGW